MSFWIGEHAPLGKILRSQGHGERPLSARKQTFG